MDKNEFRLNIFTALGHAGILSGRPFPDMETFARHTADAAAGCADEAEKRGWLEKGQVK